MLGDLHKTLSSSVAKYFHFSYLTVPNNSVSREVAWKFSVAVLLHFHYNSQMEQVIRYIMGNTQ